MLTARSRELCELFDRDKKGVVPQEEVRKACSSPDMCATSDSGQFLGSRTVLSQTVMNATDGDERYDV